MGNAYQYCQQFDDALARGLAGILVDDRYPITQESLKFWLDASQADYAIHANGRISQIHDRSMMGNHFIQPDDTRSANFQAEPLGYHIAGDEQIYCPTLENGNFPASGTLMLAISVAYDETTNATPVFDNYSSGRNHLYIRTYAGHSIQAALQVANAQAYAWVTTPAISSPDQILTLTWDAVARHASLYLGGQLNYEAAIIDPLWDVSGQVCDFRSTLTAGMLVKEAMLFDQSYGQDDLAFLHEYLARKWS